MMNVCINCKVRFEAKICPKCKLSPPVRVIPKLYDVGVKHYLVHEREAALHHKYNSYPLFKEERQ